MAFEASTNARGDSIYYTPTVAVAAGQIVLQGDLFGYATKAIAANELGSLTIEGIVEIAKLSTDVVTVGAKLYWDDTANTATVTAGTLKVIGKAVTAAGNPSATCLCKLTP